MVCSWPPAHCRKEAQEAGSGLRPVSHSTVRGRVEGGSRSRSRRAGVSPGILAPILEKTGLAGF